MFFLWYSIIGIQSLGEKMIFDTHAHYDDEQFDIDRKELLHSMKDAGIDHIVDVGASLETTRKALELAHEYDFIYAAVGVHPSETEELNEDNLDLLKEWSTDARCVAIGEIGLDYHWPDPTPEIQQKWFRRQLQLAREVRLPVIIHSRDAASDTIDIMKQEHAEEIGGVVHCFSYSKEIAKICADMGFYIGITGWICDERRGGALREAVKLIPLDRIMAETDAPYLTPRNIKGLDRTNVPQNIKYVVAELAKNMRVSADDISFKREYREIFRDIKNCTAFTPCSFLLICSRSRTFRRESSRCYCST